MTETIFFDLVKLSPAFGILAWFVWYLIGRNEAKDERVNAMHKEVVELVNDVKNEMRELVKTNQKDLMDVIKETQVVIINNTIAINEMKNTIEKNVK